MQSSSLPAAIPINRCGVVAVVTRSEQLLVVRRSATVVAPGMFCFPGGGIEPGETEGEALVREFQEELGAALRPLRRIWRCQTAWQVDLAWWLGELDEAATLSPNPEEIESIHWLRAAHIGQLANLLDSNQEFLRNLASGRISLTR